MIVRKNSDDFEMTNVLLDENEDYGCLLSSNNAIITYSNLHNNGLNGVFIQSVSGASISHNDFKGNGLSEARVISSYEVKFDFNNFNTVKLPISTSSYISFLKLHFFLYLPF